MRPCPNQRFFYHKDRDFLLILWVVRLDLSKGLGFDLPGLPFFSHTKSSHGSSKFGRERRWVRCVSISLILSFCSVLRLRVISDESVNFKNSFTSLKKSTSSTYLDSNFINYKRVFSYPKDVYYTKLPVSNSNLMSSVQL